MSIFKLAGGFGCALANVFLLMHSDTIIDVVKDFVAVGIINEVDNVIATARFKHGYFSGRSAAEKVIWVNRKLMRLGYDQIFMMHVVGKKIDEVTNETDAAELKQ